MTRSTYRTPTAATPAEPPARYTELFQKGPDTTEYDRLDGPQPLQVDLGYRRFLAVQPDILRHIAAEAFARMAHRLRPTHLQSLREILDDPQASDNDRYVARSLLDNAVVAAAGTLPMCQDTGSAAVFAEKGQYVLTDGSDAAALSEGIRQTYAARNLRFSLMAPLTTFDEQNTKTNLPAQIDISAVQGSAYRLLFVAKGGGSANKTFLFQATPAQLSEQRLVAFLEEKIQALGTTACPPYHLAIVIGGLSAEQTLKTVKLASCHDLDDLPDTGSVGGRAFRDQALERTLLEFTQRMNIGAQFGGKYFCHDVRVVRLPRHATSLPIGLAVSCSADRQVKAKITSEGVFIERLEAHPARFLPESQDSTETPPAIDLDRPMDEVCAQLSRIAVGSRVLLSGALIVARDRVHAALLKRLSEGGDLPRYFKDTPVYYSAPARTPAGYASGSFGPTTSGRMDPFVAPFQAVGGSRVMLGKGNRSRETVDACRTYGGFYLGTIGGAAALAAQHIEKSEVIDFEEFGMEAVWRIEVKDFPAFVMIDDKGNEFFDKLIPVVSARALSDQRSAALSGGDPARVSASR